MSWEVYHDSEQLMVMLEEVGGYGEFADYTVGDENFPFGVYFALNDEATSWYGMTKEQIHAACFEEGLPAVPKDAMRKFVDYVYRYYATVLTPLDKSRILKFQECFSEE